MSEILVVAVICAAAAVQAPRAAAALAPPCKTNEVLVACSHPDSVCGKLVPLFCSLLCGPRACRCRPRYSRNAIGQCVANSLCKPTPPLKSIIPTCKANEDFVLCSRPEASCANSKPPPTPIGASKCQCTGGFARVGVNCVPFGSCPTTSTSTSTTTTTTSAAPASTMQVSILSCDAGWSQFYHGCYRLSSTYASQQAAKADCANNAAHLVIIRDMKEHEFVKSLMLSSASNCGSGPADACRMWLGLERICHTVDDCAFNWVDNTSLDLTYSNWAQDEPSFSSKNEFCVEMLNDGFWNDANCGSSRIWMCVKTPNVEHASCALTCRAESDSTDVLSVTGVQNCLYRTLASSVFLPTPTSPCVYF